MCTSQSTKLTVFSRFSAWVLLEHSTRNDPSLNLLVLLRDAAINWKTFCTELTASVLKKSSKTDKRLRERFLVGQNRTKCANFLGVPFFQAMYNIKTEKQSIHLADVSLMLGCWQKEKGMRASCPFPSCVLFLPPASYHQTDTS